MSQSNPTLAEVIHVSIEDYMNGIHTAIPAIVDSYDYKTQKAKVVPAVKRISADGSLVKMPVITNVPVMWSRAGKAMIHFPLNRGDSVLLVFCERSVDLWLKNGGIADPSDSRWFDLTDAIAIPGLFPFSEKSLATDNETVQFIYGDSVIKMKDDGAIDINDGIITIEPSGNVSINGDALTVDA
jgi:hypothetical protein